VSATELTERTASYEAILYLEVISGSTFTFDIPVALSVTAQTSLAVWAVVPAGQSCGSVVENNVTEAVVDVESGAEFQVSKFAGSVHRVWDLRAYTTDALAHTVVLSHRRAT